jgi:hypothetical protein
MRLILLGLWAVEWVLEWGWALRKISRE